MKDLLKAIQNKKNIIWDWNGTIINDVDHAVAVMNNMLEKRSMKTISKEHYKSIFQFPIINYYQELGFNFKKEPFADLAHEFVDDFMAGIFSCPLIEGIESVLKEVQASHKNQSVLSATDQPNLDLMVSNFKLQNYFDLTYGISDKLAASKVERGVELMEKANYSSSETIMIGDTLHDAEVAKELGIDVYLVSHGHQSH